MEIRIQLSSNYQVVELKCQDWAELADNIDEAIDLVNKLGEEVNTNTSAKPAEDVPMASEKQIAFACKLGLSESKAKKMTAKQIWQWIQDNK